MARSPLVTVIMPVYNGACFIAEALASLWHQTLADFQVLVVDDASTDATPTILAQINDSRLRVLRNGRRMGPAAARNHAIEATSSPYVAFLDSDDVAAPTRLERQLAIFQQRPDIGLVASKVEIIDATGRPTGAQWGHVGDPSDIPASMFFANCLATSSLMIDRTLIADERFDSSLAVASDYDMWLRLVDKRSAVVLSDALVEYRVHALNVTQTRAIESENCLRRIAASRLARLGITFTAEELATHRALGSGNLEGTESFVTDVSCWLDKLDDANSRAGAYPKFTFRRVLCRYWLTACEAAAWAGCWAAWPAIGRSRFTRATVADPKMTFRVAALAWYTVRGTIRHRSPGVSAALRSLRSNWAPRQSRPN